MLIINILWPFIVLYTFYIYCIYILVFTVFTLRLLWNYTTEFDPGWDSNLKASLGAQQEGHL